jgi:hypothetical protein
MFTPDAIPVAPKIGRPRINPDILSYLAKVR